MPSAADGAPDDDFDDDHEGGDHDERLDGGDGDSEGPRVLDDGHDSDASVEGNTEDFQDGYREARAQWAWTRADVDALFRRGEEAGWHQAVDDVEPMLWGLARERDELKRELDAANLNLSVAKRRLEAMERKPLDHRRSADDAGYAAAYGYERSHYSDTDGMPSYHRTDYYADGAAKRQRGAWTRGGYFR